MRIEDIDRKIERLQFLKKLCLEQIEEEDNLDTKIYKKYLELENVKNVAIWVNEQGYRIASPSTGEMIKYQSNDITARLHDKKADVREDLKEVVQKLAAKNKKQMRRFM